VCEGASSKEQAPQKDKAARAPAARLDRVRAAPGTHPSPVGAKVSGRRPSREPASEWGTTTRALTILEGLTGEKFARGRNGSNRKWLRDLLAAWPSAGSAVDAVRALAVKSRRAAKRGQRIGYALSSLSRVHAEATTSGAWPTPHQLVSDGDARALEWLATTGRPTSPDVESESPEVRRVVHAVAAQLDIKADRRNALQRERDRLEVQDALRAAVAKFEQASRGIPSMHLARALRAAQTLRERGDVAGLRRLAFACMSEAG